MNTWSTTRLRHWQQMEQDGRGDVVGQVAHHPQRRAGGVGQRREVDLQHVGLDHGDARALAPAGGQVAVEFDDGERATALQQRLGHGAQAGSDLHQRLAGPRCDGPHDLVDHHRVDQEVLAEALAGRVLVQTGGSRSSM
jgi:hypothetical protein